MLTHVEFRSDKFPAVPEEEHLVNPGIWGKRLADFLYGSLPRQGFETREPFAEDWGWAVPIINDSFRLWIGCANYHHPDGFLCFIEPHKPLVRRIFRKVDTRQRIATLQQAMDGILSESAGVREKRWWTYEEFIAHYYSGNRTAGVT